MHSLRFIHSHLSLTHSFQFTFSFPYCSFWFLLHKIALNYTYMHLSLYFIHLHTNTWNFHTIAHVHLFIHLHTNTWIFNFFHTLSHLHTWVSFALIDLYGVFLCWPPQFMWFGTKSLTRDIVEFRIAFFFPFCIHIVISNVRTYIG